jgi:hypothetical protein
MLQLQRLPNNSPKNRRSAPFTKCYQRHDRISHRVDPGYAHPTTIPSPLPGPERLHLGKVTRTERLQRAQTPPLTAPRGTQLTISPEARPPPSGSTRLAVHASHAIFLTSPVERPNRAPRAPNSASTRTDPPLASNDACDRPDRPSARPSTACEDAVDEARSRHPQTARCPRLSSSCDRRARARHVSQRGAAEHTGGLKTPSPTAPRGAQLPTAPLARNPWSGSARKAV